jgi:hypothetical protein
MRTAALSAACFLVVSLAGCSDQILSPEAESAVQIEDAVQGKTKGVPFKAEMLWSVTPTFSPGFPFGLSTFDGRCSVPSTWVLSYTVAGKASHLGNISGEGSHCAVVVWGPGGTVAGGSGSDAILTIVAANGDTFELDRVGVASGVLDSGAPWWSEEWGILEGTGRFSGADGNGVLHGVFAGFETPSIVTIDGTLSY